MKNNNSPEEKLLKLIRGQQAHLPSQDDKPAVELSSSPKAMALDLLFVRKIVFILFILSLIYFIFSLVYSIALPKQIKLSKTTLNDNAQTKEDPSQARPYEFYLEATQGKEIFSKPSSLEEPLKSAALADVDLTKDINLVGIIAGDNPQAIIEDKRNQKSYYLFKGQFVGEFQVEDIQEGKIILNHNGQRSELYL
jgi:hypothetical protein